MADVLAVLIGPVRAGTVTRLANNRLRFEYDDRYRNDPQATPLSLSMPLSIRVHTDTAGRRVVTNFLWGLLPDNEAVLDRWARNYAVATSSPFFLLGAPIGEDCAGAVSFCRPEDVDRIAGRTGDVRWLSEAEVADRLRELGRDQTAWLGRDFTGQFSLAGAQAKTALLFEDGRWGLPSGARATTHILKPSSGIFEDQHLNEHVCLSAARRAGLSAAESRIARFADQTALVVSRYDRRVVGGTVVRIHQEDLCQAMGLHPDRKYQSQGGPSPADIADLFRKTMPYSAARPAIERFTDALIWNWVTAGTDGHAKNFAILLDWRGAQLAPIYDLASILPYQWPDPHGRDVHMAMKIGGSYGMSLPRGEWRREAVAIGLEPDYVVSRARELAALAPDAFSSAAAEPEVAELKSPVVSLLVNRIGSWARQCAEEATRT